MFKIRTPWISGGLIAAIACASSIAPAQAAITTGNVAGWVKNATKVGTAPSSPLGDHRRAHVAEEHGGSEAAGHGGVIADQQAYGRYLTSEEFGSRFAPEART